MSALEDSSARVDRAFREKLAALEGASLAVPKDTLAEADRLLLARAQFVSRHIDFEARRLRAQNKGYYTISSAGHEGNAALAWATRTTDLAFLHYRSGGFFFARALKAEGEGIESNPIRSVLRGMVGSRKDPIAGGRHKVWGSRALAVAPQTSTIGSHAPKAVGFALSLARAKKLGVESGYPTDSLTICSFGDASANHSTVTGAMNTARQCAYRGYPLPLVFLCEDNGLGISVPTPKRWIEEAYGALGADAYLQVDGGDVFGSAQTLAVAMDRVRQSRVPVFVHLKTVRLLGHAGSDIESAYRSAAETRADEARDPLLQTAHALVGHGMPVAAVQKLYDDADSEVRQASAEVCDEEGLRDAEDVLWCLGGAPKSLATKRRKKKGEAPAPEGLTLAESIRHVLTDEMEKRPEMIVFGEDVGKKGGVYGVTRGLQKTFGVARVFDSLLDEQSILGMAIGAGQAGLLPVCEIQYLAYLHNAIDQLRGEASTLQFFSERQFRNPMVVRIAGYAYQKGFGGHFHNDNSIAALRDIPGLVIASPSRPEDAAGMLRSCIELAKTEGTVSVFLEPIALYHTRDADDGDEGWLSTGGPEQVEIGRARTHGRGKSLTIVSFANGLRMSLRVAARLREDGINVRVVDLRWIAPLPMEDVLREAQATGKVLIVDETRKSGGVSEAVLAGLVDAGFQGQMARVTSVDSFIPLGPAADHVLLNEAQIEAAVLALLS